MLKIEDLKEGEYYHSDYDNLVFIFDGLDKYNQIKYKVKCQIFNNKNYFIENDSFGRGGKIEKTLKLATKEQKHWLNECIKVNKFIPYEEAMKIKPKIESFYIQYSFDFTEDLFNAFFKWAGANIGEYLRKSVPISWKLFQNDKYGYIWVDPDNEYYKYSQDNNPQRCQKEYSVHDLKKLIGYCEMDKQYPLTTKECISNNDIIEIGDEVEITKSYDKYKIGLKGILLENDESSISYKVKTTEYGNIWCKDIKLVKKASQTTNYIHEKQIDSVSPQVNTDLLLFIKKVKKVKEIEILPVQSPIFVKQKVSKKQLLILN